MPSAFRFTPVNPGKMVGKTPIAKSSWEYHFMQKLDTLLNVVNWEYEPKNLGIFYTCPIEGTRKQYIPDFVVKYITGQVEIIEIKPMQFAHEGAAKTLLAKIELARNIAKWDAALAVAEHYGARFIVLTEKQLFAKKTGIIKKTRRSTV